MPVAQTKYIEIKSVTLEAKSNIKSDSNLGFFVRDALGKRFKREHRGAYTFLAWIGDIDSKDDNTKNNRSQSNHAQTEQNVLPAIPSRCLFLSVLHSS